MQIEQLIELVYWMLIVFGVLFGIALIIAIWVILVGLKLAIKKETALNESPLQSIHKYPDPMHTVSKYSKRESKQ